MAISRGFRGRPRVDADPARVPPAQYVTTDTYEHPYAYAAWQGDDYRLADVRDAA